RKAIERQQMVGERHEDYDAIGVAEDELEASVQVFNVRQGRMVGRKGLIVDKVEELTRPALVARILEQLYGDAGPEGVPKEVLVPDEPEDRELYEEFLSHVRGTRTKVRIRVPQRGGKREFLANVTRNAEEAFARHRLKRASDHNARARALTALQDALDLPEAPLRIECYDISNLAGTEIVGSMVVMEDGLPKRSDYRRFKVRTLEGQDDFASMAEVLTRRFTNYLRDREAGVQAGRRFAYPPNLVLVDGGKGQLGVAVQVLEELGLEEIPVAALAKRFEEVYRPGDPEPVRIPRDSEALYLLQGVRDEAHRFAITYHRTLRGKAMTRSVLDDVPGLGPTRRKRLLKEFGSVKKLRALSEEELVAIPWLPARVANALYVQLHGEAIGSRTPVEISKTPARVSSWRGENGGATRDAGSTEEG
ncbi:MAG: excinuclease ABC subunit UvrC, partial [Acidimicrobiia bacterium]